MTTPPKAAPGSKPVVAVLGSGSWGTALAVHLARTGHRTILRGIETDELVAMTRDRVNSRYLPGVPLPDRVEIDHDFGHAIAEADQLLVVVPSNAFREVLERARPLLRPGQRVAWATKGFELSTGKLLHEVAAEVLGPSVPTAVLSGPTLAKEVGAGLPSAMGMDPNECLPECFLHRYASAIILAPLQFQEDEERPGEIMGIRNLLDEWLMHDYRSLGYEVVRVPVLPPNERLAYVLERLGAPTMTVHPA